MNIEERKNYIGGTDAAAILGFSRWRSPLDVWAEKTGQLNPEDISQKLPVKLGVKLEDIVAELFSEQIGLKVRRVNETLYHSKYYFLAANIDRRVVGEDTILECKTTSAFNAKEWEGEEFPPEYIVQCMHYLMVTGKSKCYLAVLIGNTDFKIKEIERDDKMIETMKKKLVEFWEEYVMKKQMPTIITANDSETLQKLFPKAIIGQEIQLTDEANRIIESITALTSDKNMLDKEIKKMQNQLKAMVKENEIGNTSIYRVKWLNIHRDKYFVPESNYRMLRFNKIQG